jgi:hypothetical protein
MNILHTPIPPLVAGEKLTLREFLRRWEAMPELKRAELIRGVVYMPSPVGPEHGDSKNVVTTWIGVYAAATPGCRSSNNATTIVQGQSPQPDGHLRLLPEVGGRMKKRRGLLHGAPEFVAEICVSSASYDLNEKLELYQASRVYEYLAILMEEQEIRWHRLVRGRFRLLEPGLDGVYRSLRFPGLWLNGPAVLREDLAAVLATLQEGLKSPEHVEFASRLQEKLSS